MRSDRLLAVLLLLQAHGRLPAPEIARRLEVSTRTVQRDAEALSAAGVPVYTERGRHGGIALLAGYRTDLTGLTDDEVGALLAVAGGLGSGVGVPSAASAVRKLLAAVPAARRDGVTASRQRLLVEGGGWRRGGADDGPALPALDAALAADERVRLHYRSSDAEHPSWRTVDPYGLVSKAGTWYLVAAHRGRARMYRVGRIREAVSTRIPARRPDERTLPEVWARLRDALEEAPAAVTVRLRVRRSQRGPVLRVAEAQLTGPVEEVAVEDDAVVVDAPFRAVGAVRVLLGFGDAVEVLGPPPARAAMAGAAAEAAGLYARE